eukprot:TRINITY_DN1573_c0_g1_i14.p1 TRINITY_DN1573_c0_g1~~TRINITY_DN1573_c0_g1_i14.p1  ORF type:complete len:281 (+),score=57.79 TRINITY_DN1573_c0_g1_i14:55-897(+)
MVERPDSLWDQLQSLFRVGKLLLLVSLIQQLMLLIVNILLLALKVDRCSQDPCQEETNLFYSITLFFFTGFQMYFSISGILQKNIFEFYGFLLTSFCTLAYAIFQVQSRREDLFVVLLVFSLISQTIYFCCTKKVYKEIGFTIYKRLGPNESLRKMFRITQGYLTLLKFDLMIWLIIITAGILYNDNTTTRALIGVLLYPFAIILYFVGRHALIYENPKIMIAYQVACLVGPILSIIQLADFVDRDNIPIPLFTCASKIVFPLMKHAMNSTTHQSRDFLN